MGVTNCITLVLLTMLVIQKVSTEKPPEAGSDRSDVLTQTNNVIDRSAHHHSHVVDPRFKGVWKKNIVWKPRWVKTWQEKKVFVAVWKRMWGPAVISEWVPVAKPPPGWLRPDRDHQHHDSHALHLHEHGPIRHTSYGVPIHHH